MIPVRADQAKNTSIATADDRNAVTISLCNRLQKSRSDELQKRLFYETNCDEAYIEIMSND